MKLHSLIFTAVFLAPFLRAEEEEKPPTEVAVQVAKVVRATLTHSVTAYGSVEPEPARMRLPHLLGCHRRLRASSPKSTEWKDKQ